MPSTKKYQQTKKAVEEKIEKFFGKKNKSKITNTLGADDITAQNRKNALIVASILEATDIENSKLSDKLKTKGVEELGVSDEELHRQALIQELKEAAAVTDDMSDIDKFNLEFAKCYKNAAENGQDVTFVWAGNALAKGLELRKNLLEIEEKYRLKEKDFRLQKMEVYQNLLMASKSLDESNVVFKQRNVKYNNDAEAYNKMNDDLKAYFETSEGRAANEELKNNPTQANGAWSPKARELRQIWNKLRDADRSATQSCVFLTEAIETLTRHKTEHTQFREALIRSSGIYDEDLSAKTNAELKKQKEALERDMYVNQEINEAIKRHIGAIVVISTGSDIAKQRGLELNETINKFFQECEKEKEIIGDYVPPYPELIKEKKKNEQTNRQMNSMD